MSADEYHSLKDSISVSGVLNPITIYQGMVIDGWHRYTAANELGVHCPEEELEEWIDPVDFVKAQNDNRRHLTASQRAAAIVTIYKWVPNGANQHTKGGSAPSSHPQKTTAELAAIAGTSKRTIEQAKAADKAGLIEAVKEGALTAKEAAKVVSGKPEKAAAKPKKYTPPEQQDTSSDELAESAHAIEALSEEVEVLKDQLAVKHLEGTGEEKAQAAALITDLRSQIKTLNAELDAMRTSRDGLQRENRELMKQIGIYQRQLKQAQKA